jgi:DNA-binding MarR family transcriptional regulator
MSTKRPDVGDGLLVQVQSGFEEEFPGASALSTECFLSLGRLTMAMLSQLNQLLEGFGVPSYTSFNALTVIAGAGEPIPPSIVAKRMVVSRPTITGVLNTLDKRGLITRVGHSSDGRMQLVSLSVAGQDLVARVLPEVHHFEQVLFSGLGHEEQEILLECLAAIGVQLEQFTTQPEISLPG